MGMRYIVKVEYMKFAFEDGNSAMIFADVAKRNYFDKDEEDVEVKIIIEKKEED